MVIPLDGSNPFTVSVKRKAEIIHKLDNKYLDLDWLSVKTNSEAEFFAEQTVQRTNDIACNASAAVSDGPHSCLA